MQALLAPLAHPFVAALLPGILALVMVVLAAPVLVWSFARVPHATQSFFEEVYETLRTHAVVVIGLRVLAERVVVFLLCIVLYVVLVGIVVTLPGAGVVTVLFEDGEQSTFLAPHTIDPTMLIAVLLVAVGGVVGIALRTCGVRASMSNVVRRAAYRAAGMVLIVWYRTIRTACIAHYQAEPVRTAGGCVLVLLAVASPLACSWCAPLYPLVGALGFASALACIAFMTAAWLGYTAEHVAH